MSKNIDTTKKQVAEYIDSTTKIDREFGVEEMPQEAVEQVKSEIEKATRRLQKLMAHS